eukprot:2566887-Amphidinium_carterae.1
MVEIVEMLCFPEFRSFLACNGFLVQFMSFFLCASSGRYYTLNPLHKESSICKDKLLPGQGQNPSCARETALQGSEKPHRKTKPKHTHAGPRGPH